MYFPTQEYETHRLLALLGDIQLDYMQERYLKEYVFNKEEYDELIKDCRFLNALQAAGVDNWSGYGKAFDILKEWDEEGE